MYTYKAQVLKVIDGDTIEVLADLGFDVHRKVRLRLSGYDAPEIRTKNRKEKEEGVRVWKIAQQYLNDAEVVIETEYKKTFDRYVAVVWKKDININEILKIESVK